MLIKRVLQYNSMLNLRRRLATFTPKLTRIHDHNEDTVDKFLPPEILLSEENIQRATQCMQKSAVLPPPPVLFKPGTKSSPPTNEKTAAVLICLCTDEKNEVSILYTRRSGLLTRHVFQISFPGGIKDADDDSFIDCALRETEEEIGLPRKRIHVWGSGTLINTPQSAVMPVFASVDDFNLKELSLNADEVHEAFLVNIKELVHPKTLRHTQFKGGWSSPNFVVGRNIRIWGLTGFITNAFLRCLIPMDLKGFKHHIKYVRPFKHKK